MKLVLFTEEEIKTMDDGEINLTTANLIYGLNKWVSIIWC